ncbi:proteasome-associated protein ECM29-like protein [Senna tora]|uniref:Proteasome-associated protein ECM29-like protein n=1 Tax=Senna tora TaxID=362788 RepID=A0A834WBZ7_9FABA|nr:proteasome-associated protein ECM29-like protein [Senna tora]
MAESSSSKSALAAKSDAEIEELLDRMLTRLALCDDSKLEPLLSKLLPLCISSLSSQSSAVRNKVTSVGACLDGIPVVILIKLSSSGLEVAGVLVGMVIVSERGVGMDTEI